MDREKNLQSNPVTQHFVPRSYAYIKRHRYLAKKLKKTPWWQEKIKKGQCYYCGKIFPPQQLTMDHLQPLVRGGQTGKNNVVVACKPCNAKKSFKTLVELRLKKI